MTIHKQSITQPSAIKIAKYIINFIFIGKWLQVVFECHQNPVKINKHLKFNIKKSLDLWMKYRFFIVLLLKMVERK